MKVDIIKIGNSKGIRLSSTVLKKYSIGSSVQMVLEDDQIVLKPIESPRAGWENKMGELNKGGDDKLLINDVFLDDDFEEW